MSLNWSHAVVFVNDKSKMLDFYCRVLGFSITDEGQIRDGTMEIVFLSQSPVEHHQLAFIPIASDDQRAKALAHLAFRADSLSDLRSFIGRLRDEAVALRPVSHGNTWSVYFDDPEQNGIELFCDTPWHVMQPAGETWDLNASDKALMSWTKETFATAPGFESIEQMRARGFVETSKR
ncbi:MAG: VOC family protein [Pseudomonadota bacterium]